MRAGTPVKVVKGSYTGAHALVIKSTPKMVGLELDDGNEVRVSRSSVVVETDDGLDDLLPQNTENPEIKDITIQFMYTPRTMFATLFFIILSAYFVRSHQTEDAVANLQYGLGFGGIFLVILGLLVFPSGPFSRPHPAFWRLCFGLAVLYELVLLFAVFQKKGDVRSYMKLFDSSLGMPLKEKSYAENCDFTWENVSGNVFDIYMVAHFLGWFVRSLMVRDWKILMVMSVTWELVEIGFTHHLPNFAECWWDQWLLDVAIANAGGIACGMWFNRYFESKEYNWHGVFEIPTKLGKMKRMAQQFTPESWTKVDWRLGSMKLKMVTGIIVILCICTIESLNHFYLKSLLWLDPDHPLNIVRLVIVGGVALPAMRQSYYYFTEQSDRFGAHSFILCCVLATELLLIYHLAPGEFIQPMDEWNYNVTVVAVSVYVISFVSCYGYLGYQQFKLMNQRKKLD